jgi:hypothetical protein
MSQFNESDDGHVDREWRLPIIRLNIQEVRGFVVITTHENAKWLLDHQGRYLPGIYDAYAFQEIGVWAWSQEIWWGGVVGLTELLGPYLDVELGNLCIEIAWSHLFGLEAEGAYIHRLLERLEGDLDEMQNVTIVKLVSELQEIIRHLSTFKSPPWGIVLISLPEGFRCELVGDSYALAMYIEQDLVFPSPKKADIEEPGEGDYLEDSDDYDGTVG